VPLWYTHILQKKKDGIELIPGARSLAAGAIFFRQKEILKEVFLSKILLFVERYFFGLVKDNCGKKIF